jgi:hypothetical protein
VKNDLVQAGGHAFKQHQGARCLITADTFRRLAIGLQLIPAGQDQVFLLQPFQEGV